MANTILGDLKTKGRVARGWLGISIQDISEDMAKNMNYKNRSGAVVSDVIAGDPADRAGIKVYDIITEVNGKTIKDSHDLLLKIAALHVGEKISIKVIRGGKEKIFNLTVAERKDKPETALAKEKSSKAYFGIIAQEISPEISKRLGIPRESGVIIIDIENGSPAEDAGLRPQDIVVQVNRVKISSIKQYTKEIGKAAENRNVTLLVQRGKSRVIVSLHVE